MHRRNAVWILVLVSAACSEDRRVGEDASTSDAAAPDMSIAMCEEDALRCREGVIEACEGATWTERERCDESCESTADGPRCTMSCDACADGAQECVDAAVRTCRRADSGCLEWDEAIPCESGACADASSCAEPVFPPGTLRSGTTFGGGALDFPLDVAPAPDGGLVVVGYFEDAIDFGGGTLESEGGRDVFVTRYADDGSHRWSRSFGAGNDDVAQRATFTDAGELIVAGLLRGPSELGVDDPVEVDGFRLVPSGEQFFFARFDDEGTVVAAEVFAARGGISGIAAAPGGDVLLAGDVRSVSDFGGGDLANRGGSSDLFVARFTRNGNHVWSQRYGSTEMDFGTCVATDAGGDVFITGVFRRPMNLGGGELEADGPNHMFLARFRGGGSHVWSVAFDGEGTIPTGIGVDPSGLITVAGRFIQRAEFGGERFEADGSDDMFLAQYGSDGTHRWSQRFGGTSPDSANDLTVDPSGSITVVGSFGSNVSSGFNAPANFGGATFESDGNSDVFVARYDAAGRHLWSRHFGGEGADIAWAVSSDPDGVVAAVGTFGDELRFGTGSARATGVTDGFLLRLSP